MDGSVMIPFTSIGEIDSELCTDVANLIKCNSSAWRGVRDYFGNGNRNCMHLVGAPVARQYDTERHKENIERSRCVIDHKLVWQLRVLVLDAVMRYFCLDKLELLQGAEKPGFQVFHSQGFLNPNFHLSEYHQDTDALSLYKSIHPNSLYTILVPLELPVIGRTLEFQSGHTLEYKPYNVYTWKSSIPHRVGPVKLANEGEYRITYIMNIGVHNGANVYFA
jgi:hypothetical protein